MAQATFRNLIFNTIPIFMQVENGSNEIPHPSFMAGVDCVLGVLFRSDTTGKGPVTYYRSGLCAGAYIEREALC